MRWIIKSSLVGELRLHDGRVLMTHLIGRGRILCTPQAHEFLSAFETPVSDASHELRQFTQDKAEFGWLKKGIESYILRYSGINEKQTFRNWYTQYGIGELPSVSGIVKNTSLADITNTEQNDALQNDDLKSIRNDSFYLSQSLALIEIPDKGVVLTHPANSTLFLAQDLWAVALQFQHKSQVKTVYQNLCQSQGMDEARFLNAVLFLQEKSVLFRNDNEELAMGEAYAKQFFTADEPLKLFFPAKERWRQVYRPFNLDVVSRVNASAKVAFVGPCLVQQHLECFEFLSTQKGIRVETHGFLIPDEKLQVAKFDLIYTAAVSFCTDIYTAIADQQFDLIKKVFPRICVAIDEHIDNIRKHSDAPIVLAKLSRCGLNGLPAISDARHKEIALIAEFNDILTRLTADFKNLYLLDEDDMALAFDGNYWDDEVHGSVHHAPMNIYGWLEPYVKDDNMPVHRSLQPVESAPQPIESDLQPVDKDTTDIVRKEPSIMLAETLVNLLDLVVSPGPQIKGIVLNPDNLLWRGKLRDAKPSSDIPGTYADVEDYFYVGIHEALWKLVNSGVALFCHYKDAESTFERLYPQAGSTSRAVEKAHFSQIFCQSDTSTVLTEIDDLHGIAPDELLLLDFEDTAKDLLEPEITATFPGYRFTQESHQLRRALLSNFLLKDITGLQQSSETQTAEEVEDDVQLLDLPFDEVVHAIAKCVANETKRSLEECLTTEDYRSIGLDSLGSMIVARELEELLQVSMMGEPWGSPAWYCQSAMCAVIQRKHNEKRMNLVSSAKPAPAQKPAANLSVVNQIKRHLSDGSFPWHLKFIGYDARGTRHSYKGKDLLAFAESLADSLSQTGLEYGDRVLLDIDDPFLETTLLIACMFKGISCLILPVTGAPQDELLAQLQEVCQEHGINGVISNTDKRAFQPEVYSKAGMQLLSLSPDGELAGKYHSPGQSQKPTTEPQQPKTDSQPLAKEKLHQILMLTSGSMGKRKLIAHPVSFLMEQAESLKLAMNISKKDKVFIWTPMYHAMGLLMGLYMPLLWGVPCIRTSPKNWTKTPSLLFHELADNQATITFMPNFAFSYCAEQVKNEDIEGLNLSHVRAIVCSGEVVTAKALQHFYERFSGIGIRPSCLSSGYGSTEAGGKITLCGPGQSPTVLKIDRHALENQHKVVLSTASNEQEFVELVSSGKPTKDTHVSVIPFAEGCDVGEILISNGATDRCQSYQKQPYPKQSSAKQSSPEANQKLFYQTGDVGFLWQEELFVLGRHDDLIKKNGQFINPIELEMRAVEFNREFNRELVTGAVAFGLEDKKSGTHNVVLMIETTTENLNTAWSQRAEMSAFIVQKTGVVVDDVLVVPKGWIVTTATGKKTRKGSRAKYQSDPSGVYLG